MKSRDPTVFLTVLVCLVSACDSEEPTAPERGEGSLTGRVAFVKTGEGVANLVAALVQGGDVVATAHTGPAGGFAFPRVTPGEYSVRLTGLELTDLPLRATALDPLEAAVTLGSAPSFLSIAAVGLLPPRVSGEVTCGSVPVQGARLRVIGGEDTDVTVATDVRGKYAATDLSVGTYAVVPLAAPCDVQPALGVVTVSKGQAGEVDFGG